jgi:starch synthase (maltosyl-transferring)
VGSPWAIGAKEGGHKAVHPQLGTIEDFCALVAKAKEYGIEVAMDIAFQCAPDHPYVKEHPSWFRWRPDGTVQYAENPPKKYQDIYPFNFETDDWQALWEELKSVFEFWIDKGVRIFRVDNPHTKPFPMWEWMIREIKATTPNAIFLAEAFTRPKVMHRLAKLGYTHSYTYFTWRNTKWELTEYITELTRTQGREYFRPNFWPNTPDILNEYLQFGGRPAFLARLVLAATLTANYGIYGPAYELVENKPVRHGSEEYLDSEKYQIRQRDLDQPSSLKDFIARVNSIRKSSPALQQDWNLHFHPTDNE